MRGGADNPPSVLPAPVFRARLAALLAELERTDEGQTVLALVDYGRLRATGDGAGDATCASHPRA